MSVNARQVLSDCQIARSELALAIDEKKQDLARIRWTTCVTLLRAVGHVLRNVDSRENKEISTRLFESWKREPIFSEFIEKERNEILKQYEHRIELAESGVPIYLNIGGGDRLLLDATSGDILLVGQIDDQFDKSTGYGEGGSACEVIDRAICWWGEKLDEFDETVLHK